MKIRKKPVVLDAYRYTGIVPFQVAIKRDTLPHWLSDAVSSGTVSVGPNGISIETLEGTMRVSVDDVIIKGIAGELYPCKPDIFDQTYDIIG